MDESQHTNGELTVATTTLDGITSAVAYEIRQAEARATNFNLGLPSSGDVSAVDYFIQIEARLEAELERVRFARFFEDGS
jgi:hypothetical protein